MDCVRVAETAVGPEIGGCPGGWLLEEQTITDGLGDGVGAAGFAPRERTGDAARIGTDGVLGIADSGIECVGSCVGGADAVVEGDGETGAADGQLDGNIGPSTAGCVGRVRGRHHRDGIACGRDEEDGLPCGGFEVEDADTKANGRNGRRWRLCGCCGYRWAAGGAERLSGCCGGGHCGCRGFCLGGCC